MSKKVVITGVTGLLGSKLAEHYASLNFTVVGLKRKSTFTPKFDFPIDIFEGDIRDELFLLDCFKDAELVIHTAAIVSFDRRDKEEIFNTNVLGTKAVVNTCLLQNVPRLIFVSSVAALGRKTNGAIVDEETLWENSEYNTNYAYSKYLAEQEFWRGIEEGLNGFCVNPSIILGCGDIKNSSNKIFSNLFKKFVPYTEGSINVVDLRDVVKIIVQLEEKKANEQKYILNGTSVEVKSLFEYFSEYSGARLIKATKLMVWLAWGLEGIYTFFVNKRSQLTRETLKVMEAETIYNNDKLVNELDYQFYGLDETMKHCITYYVEKYK